MGWRESLGIYAGRVVKVWYAIVFGVLMAVIGAVLVVEENPVKAIPAWVFFLLMGLAFYVAQFVAFHQYRVEMERHLVTSPVGRKALLDFITEQHTYGVHELLNKAPTVNDGGYALVEWTEKGAAWVERILRTMTERGCSAQQLALIEPLGIPRHIKGYSQDNVITHRFDMIQERLGRLKELETDLSDGPEYVLTDATGHLPASARIPVRKAKRH